MATFKVLNIGEPDPLPTCDSCSFEKTPQLDYCYPLRSLYDISVEPMVQYEVPTQIELLNIKQNVLAQIIASNHIIFHAGLNVVYRGIAVVPEPEHLHVNLQNFSDDTISVQRGEWIANLILIEACAHKIDVLDESKPREFELSPTDSTQTKQVSFNLSTTTYE